MFTEAPPSEYYAVLGVTSSMNPGKILLVSVTHIFHVKKLKHKEISSLAQESAAKKQQSRGPLPAPAQCPLCTITSQASLNAPLYRLPSRRRLSEFWGPRRCAQEPLQLSPGATRWRSGKPKPCLLFIRALGRNDARGEGGCSENVKTEFYLGKRSSLPGPVSHWDPGLPLRRL